MALPQPDQVEENPATWLFTSVSLSAFPGSSPSLFLKEISSPSATSTYIQAKLHTVQYAHLSHLGGPLKVESGGHIGCHIDFGASSKSSVQHRIPPHPTRLETYESSLVSSLSHHHPPLFLSLLLLSPSAPLLTRTHPPSSRPRPEHDGSCHRYIYKST